jgi:hypothetical protein
MGALLALADGADAQLLQGLVVEFAAVVLAHAWTRPDRHHKVKLLMNGLVTGCCTNGLEAVSVLVGAAPRNANPLTAIAISFSLC